MKIKKINQDAVIPTRGSEHAAGYDLYSIDDYVIHPGSGVQVHTGLAMEIPEGYFGAIYPRSGLSFKKGLRNCNCVGVVDSDYRGEIIVALYNDSAQTQFVSKCERVAQMIFSPYAVVYFTETQELNDTERGTGGFGSTGTN